MFTLPTPPNVHLCSSPEEYVELSNKWHAECKSIMRPVTIFMIGQMVCAIVFAGMIISVLWVKLL
jgi:hypothetical protein